MATPQTTSATATDGTPVDPTAASLTKAIRQVESGGNYNASGASGEHGAYQWMPGNFEASAKQYGLDPNDFSPVNQDKVAYHHIKDLLDQGYSQSQVASMWNSGSPDWEGKVGVNKEGVKYDTPAYVNRVKAAYLEQSSQPVQSDAQGQGQQTGYGYVQPPPPITPDTASPAPTPQPQQQGLVGNLVQGASDVLAKAESPFMGVAAAPLQAGIKGYNALTGSNVADPFAQGVPAGLPGVGTTADVTPLDAGKKIGDAMQVGSYFVPGGEGMGALAGGAAMGALQGAGSALSGGADLPTAAVQGGIGAVENAGLAGGAQALGAGVRAFGDHLSGEGLSKAVQGIKDAYSSALNLNASERGFEMRSGKDLAQVLLDNQAPLGRYENGTLDASQAIPKLQSALTPLNHQADALVQNPELNQNAKHFIALDNVQKSLEDTIKSSKLDPIEKAESLERAQKLMDASRAEYGDVISPTVAEKLKQSLQNTAFKKKLVTADALHGNVTYLAGNVLMKDIETAIGGTAGKEYGKINASRSELVDGIKRLTALDGVRLIKGGRLGNIAGGMVGAISGAASGLGPFGALAGDYFGTKAAQFMNDPATKIATAQLKAKGAGLIPGILGQGGKVVGKGLASVGKGIGKSARATGLVGNLVSQGL